MNPCLLPDLSYTSTTESLKHKPGEHITLSTGYCCLRETVHFHLFMQFFCILYYFTGQTVTLISPPVHIGERYQKLLTVLQMVEREKTRHASAAQGLQERLTRAQEEISLLQTSITERSSHYQQLHNQLLDKATQATSLEKEVSDPSNQCFLYQNSVTVVLLGTMKMFVLNCLCWLHVKTVNLKQ